MYFICFVLVYYWLFLSMVAGEPTFKPFQPLNTSKRPWLPFTYLHDQKYDYYLNHYTKLLDPSLSSKAVNALAIGTFKSVSFSLLYRSAPTSGPSGLWKQFVGQSFNEHGLGRYIGAFYDCIIVQLALFQPDESAYIQVLGLRDVLTSL